MKLHKLKPMTINVAACGFALLAFISTIAHASPPKLPTANPPEVGMNAVRLAAIDTIVAEGLSTGKMPGCVVLVARHGKIVFHRAYGARIVLPETVPMTTDTVFDMASITKPVATATSIMLLIEQGKLGLEDKVSQHIPEFAANGKEDITVRHLLTHQAGLIPDNALADYRDGPAKAFERIHALKLQQPPGLKFTYTDVGFLMLGELVQKLTGKDVHRFSQEAIFQPLGMSETGYLPADELKKRAAPTEKQNERWLQGEVHDPRAALLDGVAGHAGLFSTTTDLAVYAQMMLGFGAYGGVRVLKPETVALMTTANKVSSGYRGLGWDMRTGYSSNRGDGFSPKAFGHGGFTGTVMWIDPHLDTFFIFLSSRLHPNGKGVVNPLAGKIGTVVAGAIESPPPFLAPGEVLTGIDVLQRDSFRQLAGRNIGLITNQTGINREGVSTIRLLSEAKNLKLVALFSPEHGLEGKLDIPKIADTADPTSGLKVFSLYGETRKPTAESLQGVDTLVFDIQDIGTRYYTFVSTMANAMEAAAERKLKFVVLDRPNPINGVDVAGPVLDAGKESFVGFHTIPVRHGMTVGELATLYRQEKKLDVELQVIQAEGWRREDFFDATNLPWVNPSPNMRNLTEALLYPAIGLLETTNLSVGRGTDTPFEVIGAPWLNGRELAASLNAAELPGVRFVPLWFTPNSSKFQDKRCGGVNIIIIDRSRFEPLRTGLTIAVMLQKLNPQEWNGAGYGRLLANQAVLDAVLSGKPFAEIESLYRVELEKFQERRKGVLFY